MRVGVSTAFGHWGKFKASDIFDPGSSHMVAGGETAVLYLARALATAGHQVDVYYDLARPGTYYGVNFLPKSLKVSMLLCTDYDLLISWEDLESLQIGHRSPYAIYAIQCNAMQVGILDYGIDSYQCVSEWHVRQMYGSDQTVSPDKFFVFPNGVDLRRFAKPHPDRDPYRIIHSSSPDRGLHHLLEAWPRLKRAVPQASLHIYYDLQPWLDLIKFWEDQGVGLQTTERAHWVLDGLKRTEGMDVHIHGPVGQWQLAQEQMASGLMWYLCAPIAPTEGFSISILEALAAGTPVLTSNVDALPELWGECTVQVPLTDPEESYYALSEADRVQHFRERALQWVDEAVSLLTNRRKWKRYSKLGLEVAQDYDWFSLGTAYAEGIEAKVREKQERESNPQEVLIPSGLAGQLGRMMEVG